MHIPAASLPLSWMIIALVVWGVILARAARRVRWQALWTERRYHLLAGTLTALLLLWSFESSLAPGVGFHFLGVTLLTLMFGWPLSVIGVSLVTLGSWASGRGDFGAVGANALVLGVLPVAVSYGVYAWVRRHLPRHIFIYIFLCAFAGSMLAAGAAVFAVTLVLTASGTYSLDRLGQEYLPFLPLYLFPEGVLNGIVTTAFIGLRPHWLRTFDKAPDDE